MTNSRQRFFLRLLLVSLLSLLASEALFLLRSKEVDLEKHISCFQDVFSLKDKELEEALVAFTEIYQGATIDTVQEKDVVDRLLDVYDRKDVAFFHHHNDELILWTHNTIPLEIDAIPDAEYGVVRLKNGWYYFRQQRVGDDRFLVVTVIKYGFRYQNRFLVNRFNDDYSINQNWVYISDKQDEDHRIYNHRGDYALSLNPQRESGMRETSMLVHGTSVLLAIVGWLLFVFSAFRLFSSLFRSGKRSMAIFGFVASMVVLRLLSFYHAIPSSFYQGKLFNPALYATSNILPSLGDLFLHVLLFSILSFFLFAHLKHFSFKGPANFTGRLLFSLAIFVVIYMFCNLTIFLIRGLVINSQLNLDVNFIFNLDIFSLVGFLIIGCIFFSFFFLSVVLFRIALNLLQKQSLMWWFYMAMFFVVVGIHWVMKEPGLMQWLLYITAIVVFEMERKSISRQAGFTSLLVSLFIFSFISSLALYRFNQEKDLEKRKTLALQLASEQDPVAEFLFMEIEETLFNDHQLRNLIRTEPYNEGGAYRYLLHHYFYDFWAKYDIQVTICQPQEMLLIKPSNVVVECTQYFDEYMQSYGKATISDKLVYLDNNTGRNSYISKVPIHMGEGEDAQAEYFVFLEFDSKYVARDMGFPELLIDDKIDINRDLVNYSYATYKEGILVNKSGPYNYSIETAAYEHFEGEFAAFSFDGYRHLLFRKDSTTHIILSRPQESLLERIAPFSYLFILFFVLIVIFYMLTSRKRMREMFKLNFKKRVQVSMITIVIVSVLAIGGASTWFILSISHNKNMAFLNERAHSVLIETELTLDIDGVESLDESMTPYLSDLLLRQSNIFFADINLYDLNGNLVASSRPKVFEEGLISTRMNPKAYFSLRNQQINQFVHKEQIGKLEYLSAYMLLRNHYQELLGYINLPHFAKQGELRNEISYFMVAFINIYLLLLVVAILVALFISNFITQPLQLIRENLSRVQLGRTNQKIEWPRNDEIGALVGEYNRMIDELGASADLLARSERESAWREMAKQVAHEIKNPLTPMRLNIQYLEKAWKEKLPDWDERLNRFAKTMIEQIDNLALIAGAFSDFAQMPNSNTKAINLKEFLPEVLNLFNDSEKVTIILDLPVEHTYLWILADRNQLIRVLNNLVNNGIQAYPKNVEATIEIRCTLEGECYRIDVKDYGIGIPEALQKNIFSPNFTTKTSGMGMGLSMVKTIIENHGGKVSFHSIEGQGSIFSFKLPAAYHKQPGKQH